VSRQNLLGAGLLVGLSAVAPPIFAVEEGPAAAMPASATAAVPVPVPELPVAEPTLEERLSKLERQVNNQTILELLDRIDSLQVELQDMRALSEEQTHQIDSLKQRQRDLYLDLDRRLSRAEREASSTLPVATPGVISDGTTASLVSGEQSPQPLVQQQTATETTGMVAQTEVEPVELAQEREAYQKAFNLLRQLQYDPATAAFKSFIKKYPNGRYAHIAQYWLGEASYARRDFKQAIADYQQLIDHYPQSPKIAEAMLKLGYSRWELKAVIGAKTALDQLISKYPDSAEAKQAQPLLDKLTRRLSKQ